MCIKVSPPITRGQSIPKKKFSKFAPPIGIKRSFTIAITPEIDEDNDDRDDELYTPERYLPSPTSSVRPKGLKLPNINSSLGRCGRTLSQDAAKSPRRYDFSRSHSSDEELDLESTPLSYPTYEDGKLYSPACAARGGINEDSVSRFIMRRGSINSLAGINCFSIAKSPRTSAGGSLSFEISVDSSSLFLVDISDSISRCYHPLIIPKDSFPMQLNELTPHRGRSLKSFHARRYA